MTFRGELSNSLIIRIVLVVVLKILYQQMMHRKVIYCCLNSLKRSHNK